MEWLTTRMEFASRNWPLSSDCYPTETLCVQDCFLWATYYLQGKKQDKLELGITFNPFRNHWLPEWSHLSAFCGARVETMWGLLLFKGMCSSFPLSAWTTSLSSCPAHSLSYREPWGYIQTDFPAVHGETSRPVCGLLIQSLREPSHMPREGRLCQDFKLNLLIICIVRKVLYCLC